MNGFPSSFSWCQTKRVDTTPTWAWRMSRMKLRRIWSSFVGVMESRRISVRTDDSIGVWCVGVTCSWWRERKAHRIRWGDKGPVSVMKGFSWIVLVLWKKESKLRTAAQNYRVRSWPARSHYAFCQQRFDGLQPWWLLPMSNLNNILCKWRGADSFFQQLSTFSQTRTQYDQIISYQILTIVFFPMLAMTWDFHYFLEITKNLNG